jgi:hypothetical protein
LFRCRCGSYANVFALRCIYQSSRSECGFHSSIWPSSKLLEIVEPWRRGLGGCSIPDRVTSSQSDPLRNRSVLLLGSGELLLRAEGLVALLNASSASILQIFFGIPLHPRAHGLPLPSASPWHLAILQATITGKTYRHRDDCRGVEDFALLREVGKIERIFFVGLTELRLITCQRALATCTFRIAAPRNELIRFRKGPYATSQDFSKAASGRRSASKQKDMYLNLDF